VLIGKRGSGLPAFSREVVRRRYHSPLAASRLTTSRLPLSILIGYQIYFHNAHVGRPDLWYAPSQFIPFHPFLSGGMYCSAPHWLPALKLSLVGTLLSLGASQLMLRCLRLDAGGVLLLNVAGWRTAVRFRIAWTAIAGAAGRCTLLLLDVARALLPGEREGLLSGSRLQPFHCVAVKICYASRQPRISSENTAVFCLDPQILARSGY